MKIVVIGGGPGGLYFSLLMKKANPAHDITVYERNRRDDTFGFGVVFSDETLSNFMGHDAPTYRAITERFAYWNTIEVRYHDQVIRAGGHGFCGISRQVLLNILQRRCASLGVSMHFESEIDDVERPRQEEQVNHDEANKDHDGCTPVGAQQTRPEREGGGRRGGTGHREEDSERRASQV